MPFTNHTTNYYNRIKSKAFRSLDRLYHYTSPPRHKKHRVYGAIIINKNKLGNITYALVQGRYTKKWSFPKGHSEKNENPIDCTLREVSEETGLESLPEPIDCLSLEYGTYFVFKLHDSPPLIPRDTHEIINTKWVTLDEMNDLSLNSDAYHFKMQLQRAF